MKQTRVIAVLNQKGGVGKTTIASNLVHGLARKGYQVLAIDLDPQAQLTVSLGLFRNYQMPGLEKALVENEALSKVAYPVRDNLMLVPAGHGLSDIENLTTGGASRGLLLRNSLQGQVDNYDYVVIDCPPSSGLLVVNAIFACREIIIPMTGDFLALQGISHLMGTLKNFENSLNHTLVQWIVLSRFQARRRLSKEVKEKLISYFPGKLFRTEITESVSLAECPSFGKSIFEYQPNSRAAQQYETLVDDLIIGRTH